MLGVLKSRKNSSPTATVHELHRLHALGCSSLVAALVFLQGLMSYKGLAPACPPGKAWFLIGGAAASVLAGMWMSLALPAACLRHRKAWSWLAGIAILTGCFAASFLLLRTIPPYAPIVSHTYNPPPAAGLMKDLFIMWLFAWAIAANTFNAVAAFEHLIRKRQFVTVGECLGWNSPLEARIPIRCFAFPWGWGMLAIALVALLLVVLELSYYASLQTGTAAWYWLTFLGIGRDLVFLAAIAEVMLFYKAALADVRHALR